MRTVFGTFKLGCWIYMVLSVIITVIVLMVLAKHAPEMNATTPSPLFP